MADEKLIAVTDFCKYYDIPDTFIRQLAEYELIEVIATGKKRFINEVYVADIERYIRLHYDLNINIEGLDVVKHLLHQVEQLQRRVNDLSNQLDFYRIE